MLNIQPMSYTMLTTRVMKSVVRYCRQKDWGNRIGIVKDEAEIDLFLAEYIQQYLEAKESRISSRKRMCSNVTLSNCDNCRVSAADDQQDMSISQKLKDSCRSHSLTGFKINQVDESSALLHYSRKTQILKHYKKCSRTMIRLPCD